MSPKQKRLTANEIIKILKNNDFEFIGQKGSHQKWKNYSTGHQVTVPYHKKSHQLPIGTLRSTIDGSSLDKNKWN